MANAKAIKKTAAGRTQSNQPKADLHRNFPLSTFNLQLNSPLFNTLSLTDLLYRYFKKGLSPLFYSTATSVLVVSIFTAPTTLARAK
ncbi:MAG: hypothetical protein KH501_12440, partial [Eubacterium limosum]|nr:hypothetical protein [Eubacterium limosum]